MYVFVLELTSHPSDCEGVDYRYEVEADESNTLAELHTAVAEQVEPVHDPLYKFTFEYEDERVEYLHPETYQQYESGSLSRPADVATEFRGAMASDDTKMTFAAQLPDVQPAQKDAVETTIEQAAPQSTRTMHYVVEHDEVVEFEMNLRTTRSKPVGDSPRVVDSNDTPHQNRSNSQ